MIFDFYPWKLDIDVQETKKLYIRNDDAVEKAVNEKLYRMMSERQKIFFSSIGVDFFKIKAEEKQFDTADIKEEEENKEETAGENISLYVLNFLVCGKFLTLPDYQKELYSDDEVFGKDFPESLTCIHMPEEERLPVYDVDGWGCVFKHPFFRFESDKFKKWDCGYILGSILFSGEK